MPVPEDQHPARTDLAGVHVVLGVTGGIAAYKAAEIARALGRAGAQVQAVLTADAERFVTRATFAALTGRPVPADLWEDPSSTPHVALARTADVLLVAPATAHTLARLAHGFADDLLTNLALAFGGPLVLAPAMHTEMWEHQATRLNVATLAARGARIVPPASGPLTSGDTGVGRLAEPGDIVAAVAAAATGGDRTLPSLSAPVEPAGGTLTGRRVLVTLGGTQEPIDPVRYLGNRSSGRMGAAVVAEVLRRGGAVTAVVAHATATVPPGARRLSAPTAQELHDTVLAEAQQHDVVVMAAAVADFRPRRTSTAKLKKDRGVPTVALEPTPDVLAALGRHRRDGQVLVGFAAETDDHVAAGRDKLARKRVDLVVVNHVEGDDSAFGGEAATTYLVDADGDRPLGRRAKSDVARALLDWVERHLDRVAAAQQERAEESPHPETSAPPPSSEDDAGTPSTPDAARPSAAGDSQGRAGGTGTAAEGSGDAGGGNAARRSSGGGTRRPVGAAPPVTRAVASDEAPSS